MDANVEAKMDASVEAKTLTIASNVDADAMDVSPVDVLIKIEDEIKTTQTQTQANSKYFCSICNKQFKENNNFSQHKRTKMHTTNVELNRVLYKVSNIDVIVKDFNDLKDKKWVSGSILDAFLFSKRFENSFLALGIKLTSFFADKDDGRDYFDSINIHMHDFIIGCFLIKGKLVLGCIT